MLWFSTSGRASKMASSDCRVALAVRDQHLDGRARACGPGWPRWSAAMAPAPPSARSSRATQVTTAWPSPIRSTACGHPLGLVGRQRQRVAGVDLAEAAGPGAALAVDHEGRGAVGPALVDVRAARLLAHGDEAEVVDGRPELAVALADAHRDPHPVRLALRDVEARPRAPPRPGAGAAAAVARPRAERGRSARRARSRRRGAPRRRRRTRRRPGPRRRRRPSSIGTSTPSARSEVTPRSAMPHGTMWPNMARSEVDVERDAVQGAAAARADPHRPHADGGDLARVGSVGVDPDAGVLVRRSLAPGSPRSASVSITTCSRRCTCAGPDDGSSGTVTIG